MDATANSLPENFTLQGFPTFYFVTKGKKEAPILYDGKRNSEEILKFLKSNAVASFHSKDELWFSQRKTAVFLDFDRVRLLHEKIFVGIENYNL